MRLTVSRASFVTAILVILCASAVFGRLMFVRQPFSYDYGSYLVIIDRLSSLSFSEMIGANFIFPYVITNGIAPMEIGFSILVKAVTLFIGSPEIVFALIASASVGLRVYTMESLHVPRVWILVLNIFAITLFEANALRLGLASSILLFGLYQLFQSRPITGYTTMGIAVSIHLQVALFLLPFLTFFFFSWWITRSKLRIGLFLFASSIASYAFIQFIPFINNIKVAEYIAQGASSSSGLTITSALAAGLLAISALMIGKSALANRDTRFWAAIVSASVPSAVLLMFLTNVAVIGDRAWQLAFLVLATFFFSGWATVGQKMIPLVFLFALAFTSVINVTVRYPLSNFWSPPFPHIEATERF